MTMPRIVTCHQPTYLPWPGLFHKLALADVFVVMDTVAYSRTGWQNRNRIKGSNGVPWLTVPLNAASLHAHRLVDAVIDYTQANAGRRWQRRHWRALHMAYARAPGWSRYAPVLEDVYLGQTWTSLVELNLTLVRRLAAAFEVSVDIVRASEIGGDGAKSQLVLDMCRRTSASLYVSGEHGLDYLIERDFVDESVSVFYQRYRAPRYEQRFGPFVPNLSSVDLLFNLGADSAAALRAGNVERGHLLETVARSGSAVVIQTSRTRSTPADSLAVRPPRS